MKAPLEIRPASRAGLGYARHGHGPVPVLVLHDWLGDHANYEALLPWLDGQAFTHPPSPRRHSNSMKRLKRRKPCRKAFSRRGSGSAIINLLDRNHTTKAVGMQRSVQRSERSQRSDRSDR